MLGVQGTPEASSRGDVTKMKYVVILVDKLSYSNGTCGRQYHSWVGEYYKYYTVRVKKKKRFIDALKCSNVGLQSDYMWQFCLSHGCTSLRLERHQHRTGHTYSISGDVRRGVDTDRMTMTMYRAVYSSSRRRD